MKPYGIVLAIILCLFAHGDSGRIKRQSDYEDYGLTFITVESKPSQEISIGNNHFVGNSLTDNSRNAFARTSYAVEQVNTFSLETENNEPARPRPRKSESKIPGRPGIDYPMLHKVPETNFRCSDTPAIPGMYANIETGCQAYHVCHDGRDGPQGASFLCTNGTLFNQKEFICDWWYNVDCGLSLLYYGLNLDPLKNPYTKVERERDLRKLHDLQFNQYGQ